MQGTPPSAQPGVGVDSRADQDDSTVTADAMYQEGIALAQTGQLRDAESAFLQGRKLFPADPRFPTELGGIAFKEKNYRQAIHWLHEAEKLAPDDAYIHDFLGTLYFVQGNQEAAIAQWNRVGKPVIEDIHLQPELRLDPVVLDRSFAFSRGETLKLADLRTTDARLRALGIYPMFALRMSARPDGRFDVNFTAQEQNGFGSRWEALLGTFGRAFYQTISPEYYNAGGTATNISSLWRWDSEKRRIEAAVSTPLRRNPQWRFRSAIDLRNENWDVRNFSNLPVATLGFLNMRRSAGSADITSFKNGKFVWTLGAEISYRDFRCGDAAVPRPCTLGGADAQPNGREAKLLAGGYQLQQRASATYDLLRVPERQYRLAVKGGSELARLWSDRASVFEKLQGEFIQSWVLTGNLDGPQLTNRLRAGKTFGDAPFGELFMLGVERDNPLMLRGHIGTNDSGRKGNAPLGRNYFLSNNDIDKRIWSNGLVAIRLGPFVDIGKITDSLPFLGSKKWLVDAGGQVTLRLLGLGVHISYGRDLRAGHAAFYTWVGR